MKWRRDVARRGRGDRERSATGGKCATRCVAVVAVLLAAAGVALVLVPAAPAGPDPSFGIGGGASYGIGSPRSIVVDAAGRLLVGDTAPEGRVRRITDSGALDTSFGVQGIATTGSAAMALALDGGGRVYVGSGVSGAAVVRRLTPGGSPDTTFGSGGAASLDVDPGFADVVNAVRVDSSGRILAVGTTAGFTVFLARFTSTGAPDASFGDSGVVLTGLGGTGDLVVAADGSSYVSGFLGADAAVVAYDEAGAPDPSFGSAGRATVDGGAVDAPAGIALAPDGGLVVAGSTGARDQPTRAFVFRLAAGGALDQSFGTGGIFHVGSPENAFFNDVAVRSDGKIVAVGVWAGSPGGGLRAFLTPDGRPDDAFAPSGGLNVGGPGSFAVQAVAFDGDGRAVTTSAAPGATPTVVVSRYVYSVPDVTPPAILPFTWSADAADANGAVVTYSPPFAYDDVAVTGLPVCEPASGSTFPIGDTTVTCTVSDAAGNVGTGELLVRVRPPGPVWTIPESVVAEAAGPDGATVTFDVAAADPLSGAGLPVTCDAPSPSLFAVGTTSVTCSATGPSGQTWLRSFPVVVRDTTPPVLALPEHVVAERTTPQGAAVTFAATAVDAVDGTVPVTCSPASGSTFGIVFPARPSAVSCSAADRSGNRAAASFAVTVVDTTPPVIDATPIVAESLGPTGSGVRIPFTDVGVTRFTEDCAPSPPYVVGSHLVSCTAVDDAGNAATALVSVTITDTTPPILVSHPSLQVDADSADGAVVEYAASAYDTVDGFLAADCEPASGSTFAPGETPVTCSAADARGNTVARELFTVHVRGAAEQFDALRADTTERRLVRLLDRIATPLAPSRQTCRLLRRYANVAARRGLADLEARARRIAAILGCA